MVCIPSSITEVEERAVVDAANQAGARKTYLIEEPVAAALGADIDITMPNGNMIVDIGGGTADIALISLNNTVVSESIKVGGDKFDEAIVRYVRKKYSVLVGERTAEENQASYRLRLSAQRRKIHRCEGQVPDVWPAESDPALRVGDDGRIGRASNGHY